MGRETKPFSWWRTILASIVLAGGIVLAADWAVVTSWQYWPKAPATARLTYRPADDRLERIDGQGHGRLASLPPAGIEGWPGLETRFDWTLRCWAARGLDCVRPWAGLALLVGATLAVVGLIGGRGLRPLLGAGLVAGILAWALDHAAQGEGIYGGARQLLRVVPPWMVALPLASGLLLFGWFLCGHRLPRARRWLGDLFKWDHDKTRRQQQDIKTAAPRYRSHNQARLAQKCLSKGYFLGLWADRRPIIIPEPQLTRHIHVLGGTGSGKTSRVLLPMAMQAIQRGRGVTLLDWKGDKQAITALCEAAHAAGKGFWLLSLSEESNSWNILQGGTPTQIADRLLIALELNFRDAARYYSLVQKATFITLVEAFVSRGVNLTARDVHQALGDRELLSALLPELAGNPRALDQLQGLRAALLPYANLPQLNAPVPDFTLGGVVARGDVLYVHASSQAYPELAAGLGKMVFMGLEAVAAARTEQDEPYLLILDEAQNAACPALKNLVATVRSANFSLLLSNQSEGQLILPELGGEGFLQTIKDNTALKVVFKRVDGEEAERWAMATGQEPYQQRATRLEDGDGADGGRGTALDGRRAEAGYISTQYKNYVTANTLLSLPDGCALVIGVPGHLPAVASLAHPWGLEEKRRLETAPWPVIDKTRGLVGLGGPSFESVAAELRGTSSERAGRNSVKEGGSDGSAGGEGFLG